MPPLQTPPLAAVSGRPSARPVRREIQICPNTLLTLGILLSLLFVFQLKSLSALAFLGLGMILVLRRPQSLLVETRDRLWIYSIPIWCLLTVLWSNYPPITLRYSIQLGLTFVIAITIASRLGPQIFARVAFVGYSVAALASILSGRVRVDGAWVGIYGSKNAFAATMSVFVLLALALALDRKAPRGWRLAGLIGTPVALVLLMRADGSGALLSTIAAAGVPILLVLGWRLSLVQKLLCTGVFLLLGLLGMVVLIGFHEEILAFVLQTTGKDVTLTGRTDLWAAALDEISKNPLFGQGYEAVWVPGNPIAEYFWNMFGITTKLGFHFHNNYLSNAVEIGIIGVLLQSAAFFSALGLNLYWAARNPGAANLFFSGYLSQILILSMSEVLFFNQLNPTTVLILCGLVYGLRASRAGATAAQSRLQGLHQARSLPR